MDNEQKDDIDFIQDDIHKIQKAHARKIEGKKKPVKVRSTLQKARDDYHEARKIHNRAIWRSYWAYRSTVWQAWRKHRTTRKQHLILKHQAHNVYKLVKIQEKASK